MEKTLPFKSNRFILHKTTKIKTATSLFLFAFLLLNALVNAQCTPPDPSICDNDHIVSVQLGTLVSTGQGCPPYYQDNSSTQNAIPELIQSTSAEITVGLPGNWSDTVGVWIDFNQNGVFDAFEFTNLGLTDSNSISGFINIPPTATLGVTKMRVRSQFLYNFTGGQACTQVTWGTTRDYSVEIKPMPACSGTPNGGTVSVNPAQATIGATYTVSSVGYTIGSGMSYQWQSSTNGGAWTNIGTATSTYSNRTATAPAPIGTSVKWRLQVSCTNSGITSYSSEATFTTVACVPSYSSGCGLNDVISRVQLQGATVTLDNNSSCTLGGYANYTTGQPVPDLYFGSSYNLKISTTYTSPQSEELRVWIDYNDNGVFEASEEIGATSGAGMSGSTHTFAFTPQNIPGPHKMRVRMVYGNYNVPIDPCSSYSYGETEDYTVLVGTLSSCTGTPNAGVINGPAMICASSPFTLTAVNYTIAANLVHGWEQSTDGVTFTPIAGATAASYTSPGIAVKTYFRHSLTCTSSGMTDYSDADLEVDVLTLPSPTPCVPTGGTSTAGIVIFKLSNIDNSSSSNTPYTDYSCTVAPAELDLGEPYIVTIRSDFDSGTHGAAIWIDYNDNGDFEASEKVAILDGIGPNATVNFPAFIPTNPGLHRLRIQYTYNNTAASLSPCIMNSIWAETEDYLVNVKLPPDCNGAPNAGTAFTDPTQAPPGDSYTVYATGYTTHVQATGLKYQWQSNTNNAGWVNQGSETNVYADYSAVSPSPVGTTVRWRLSVKCSYTNDTAYSAEAIFKSTACIPKYLKGCSTIQKGYMSRVYMEGETVTLDNNTTCSPDAYGDYSSLLAVDLITGLNYDITVNFTTNILAPLNFTRTRIWIDYNNDGLFTPDEQVAYNNDVYPSTGIKTFNIIPQDAPGVHRMRIRTVMFGGSPATGNGHNIDPCAQDWLDGASMRTATYGETEDYLVNILPVCNSATSNGDWSIASNWSYNMVPKDDYCVLVPNGVQLTVDTDDAVAGTVTVENNGQLIIPSGKSLTVTDEITNNAAATGFVVEDGGNLIQVSNTAVNTGAISLEKTFTFSTERKQYNFVSSPLIGQNVKTIYSPASPTARIYDEATDLMPVDPGNYATAKGFAIRESQGGPATTTAKYTGVPFNGLWNHPIVKSATGQGYNLVGNPYPSNLDIRQLYQANQLKINPTFWFWDNRGNETYTQQGASYSGNQYAKYNAASDMGTAATSPGAVPARVPNKIVTAGTGFLVEAQNTNTLNFRNEYRATTAAAASFFGKTTDEGEPEFSHSDKYWLTLTTPSDMRVMNGVSYFEGGDDSFTIDDSETDGGSDDLYTLADGHQLTIHGRQSFTDEDQVPLGYKAYTPGYHIISIYDAEGVFAEEQTIYLIDHKLDKVWNLTKEPYRFLSRSGEFNDRFLIVYKPQLTLSPMISKNQIDFVKQNNQIVITSSIDKIAQIEIFDLNSRSVFKKAGVNANEFKVNALSFNHQIIVVTVQTETGELVSRKFVNN